VDLLIEAVGDSRVKAAILRDAKAIAVVVMASEGISHTAEVIPIAHRLEIPIESLIRQLVTL
jgi:hypothetical protein